MNVVYWILQGLLGAVMMMAGGMKAMKGKALSEDPKMGWVNDFSDSMVRGIGGLEIAAAVGLILPWALDIAPVFTPLAALGVIALMVGAMLTHRRRGETQMIMINAMIAVVAIIVAIGRFGDL